jgi:hypothetical protein
VPTVTPNSLPSSLPYPPVHHHTRTWAHHVLHLGHLCLGWFAGTLVGLVTTSLLKLWSARQAPTKALTSESVYAPVQELLSSISQGPVWIVVVLGFSVFLLSLVSHSGWLKKIGHFALSILLYWTISVAAMVASAEHSLPNLPLISLSGFVLLPCLLAALMVSFSYLKNGAQSSIELEDIPLLIVGFSAALAPFVYSLQFGLVVMSQR